jgi:RimJ/RimL family protein N-acetyltransferase
MIEIRPEQVTQEFKFLFDPNMPTAIRCSAVLRGGNAGRIFTDDLEQPHMGYVWEQDDGTLYQGGVRDRQVLHLMVELLRQSGTAALGFRDDDPMVDLFPPNPEAGAECVELDRPVRGSDLSPYLGLPSGFEVHRMTRELLEKSPHLDAIMFRHGSLDNYLDTGLEVAILHGNEFVAKSDADMEVDGIRELGVVTGEAYRGHGFGTTVVAHLLKLCDELDCATYWDCVKLNIRSLKIARKLGFGNERSYKLLAWFPPNRKVGVR